MATAAALGLVPHTGWSWLVRVSGPRDHAHVDARARVVACDVLDGELYHRAAERAQGHDRFLRVHRAAAVAQVRAALREHLAGVRAAIVLGKQVALPPTARIVASHPLIHTAEGELWRAVFAEACAEAGVIVARAAPDDLRAALAPWCTPAAIAAFLAGGRVAVGAPWSREPQDAALAGWLALLTTSAR